MNIKVIQKPITRKELIEIAKEGFGDVVKAVIDIKQEIMAVGGELHSDEEVVLVERHYTKRIDAWGVNMYPQKSKTEWLEFDSMINIKPMHGNHSRDVENVLTQKQIRDIVEKLIQD